jgi:hypothetical protein
MRRIRKEGRKGSMRKRGKWERNKMRKIRRGRRKINRK